MSDVAIKVDNVSKTFKLPHEKTGSVKNAFVGLFNGKRTYEKQEVLKNISLEIKKGEFFGIVGRNGSGKSTLLKLIAGIYSPNNGAIKVNGLLTPFIELGVGFNPELTGRENVFLNGALLGFNRSEMESMYDEIVEFAELEKFMDQKLKNYSSGMQVRLAFSIAIQAKSDILVLDEVLAVGDEAFQRKCIDVFESYKANKQTVVLVTHDMATVRRFCNRAILIDSGQIIETGEPNQVASKYSRLNREIIEKDMDVPEVDKKKSSLELNLCDQGGHKKKSFQSQETMTVKMSWPSTLNDVENAGVAIIMNSGEYMFGANTIKRDIALNGSNRIQYEVQLNLGPGKYYIMAGVFGKSDEQILDFVDRGPEFLVLADHNDTAQGISRLPHKWKVDKS